MSVKLTPKQEKFAQLYIELGNASAAYRGSYSCGKMKAASVEQNACRLLKSVKVASRVKELQAKHAERHEITVDLISAMLLEDRKTARSLEASPAATSASINAAMSLAKLHGLLVDKKEHTGKDGKAIQVEDLDERNLARWIALQLSTGVSSKGMPAVH